MEQKPSVSRIVHYVAYDTPGGEFPSGVCRAAIVSAVDDGTPDESCAIVVLNPTGLFFNQHVPHDETKRPGTWHWPERV